MRLDYMLHDIINNYHDSDGRAKYDYVRSELWTCNEALQKELEEFLGIEIPLEEKVVVTQEQLQDVWKKIRGRVWLIGTYGDEYLNEW